MAGFSYKLRSGDRVQVTGDYFGITEISYGGLYWPIGVTTGTVVSRTPIGTRVVCTVRPDPPGRGQTEVRASLLKKI